jgi:hypothetical protein
MAEVDRGAARSASDGGKRKGFFARWFEAMAESRMRHAEQEVHQHLHDDLDDRPETQQPGKGH